MTNNPNTSPIITDENGNSFYEPNNFLTQLQNMKKIQINSILTPEEFAQQQKETEQTNKIKEALVNGKISLIQNELWWNLEEALKRPNIETVNPNDIKEILLYAARQNIACAYECCMFEKSKQETQERIHKFRFLRGENFQWKEKFEWKYPALIRFQREWQEFKDYWTNLILQDPSKAGQYFQVEFRSTPQEEAEQAEIMSEFRKVQEQFLKIQNDKK